MPPSLASLSSYAPEYITEAYKRFVANQIRKAFDFRAVPITVRTAESILVVFRSTILVLAIDQTLDAFVDFGFQASV